MTTPVAVVTGAARGIGRVTAAALARTMKVDGRTAWDDPRIRQRLAPVKCLFANSIALPASSGLAAAQCARKVVKRSR